jgi:aminomethyltransferase
MKRTALYDAHQKAGARFVEFGGWEMPVQYQGILQEHQAVREQAGVFDISHMGEFRISGPEALGFLLQTLTNDAAKLSPGQGQYTLLPLETGGVVDDLYLYCIQPDEYLAIVNASRIAEDWIAFQDSYKKLGISEGTVQLVNESDDWSALAIQGPKSRDIMDQLFGAGVSELKKNQLGYFPFQGNQLFVGCTGYTGEDGFEVLIPNDQAEVFWDALIDKGAPLGLAPAGLGCRDTLRLEACFPLYGHELNEQTSPIEAGLGWFVKCDGDRTFPGADVFIRQKSEGVSRKLVALEMVGKAPPPREGYALFDSATGGEPIGSITSGALSPTFKKGIAMGYVGKDYSTVGSEIFAEIRNKRYPAQICAKPFYKRP